MNKSSLQNRFAMHARAGARARAGSNKVSEQSVQYCMHYGAAQAVDDWHCTGKYVVACVRIRFYSAINASSHVIIECICPLSFGGESLIVAYIYIYSAYIRK